MALAYFLLGMAVAYIAIPVAEGLVSMIAAGVELQVTKYSAKIYQIKQALTSEPESAPAVVGFVYQEEEEE